MSQADIDKIKKGVTDSLNQAYDAATAAEGKLNDTTQHISSTVRKGISTGLDAMSSTKSRLKDAGHTAEEHLKSSEDAVLAEVRDKVKSGIQWCKDYPLFSYTGAALLVLSFPNPRAFLLRNVFGVFQSQESAFRTASERFATLSEGAANLSKQKPDVMERARLALDTLNDARANAATTAKELSRVEAQLGTLDQHFSDIRESMSSLKHADVVSLRADVARTANEVRTDKKEVLQLLSKLRAQDV
eukprot:jgi/Ulvmu1/2771/UM014_0229.1